MHGCRLIFRLTTGDAKTSNGRPAAHRSLVGLPRIRPCGADVVDSQNNVKARRRWRGVVGRRRGQGPRAKRVRPRVWRSAFGERKRGDARGPAAPAGSRPHRALGQPPFQQIPPTDQTADDAEVAEPAVFPLRCTVGMLIGSMTCVTTFLSQGSVKLPENALSLISPE